MKKIIIIISLIFLFDSCKKDIPTSPPMFTGNPLKITGIFPSTGKPGSVLSITGTGFDTTAINNLIIFKNDFSSVDSGSSEKFFTTVPFYAETGNIKVRTKNDTTTGPVFNVIPIDTSGLNIITYTGPQLTEPQSFYIDNNNDTVKWTGVINRDTLTLSISGFYGDESSFKYILKFYNTLNNVRPHSVIGLRMYSNYSPYPINTDTLKGFAAIQDWNILKTVSGKVTVYDKTYRGWWSLIFWYKFN